LQVKLLDVHVQRHDIAGPCRALRHLVNGRKERFGPCRAYRAIQRIQGGGFDAGIPLGRRDEVVDGHRLARLHFPGVFLAMAQIMVGEIDRQGDAHHLVEIARLVVHHRVAPISGFDHVRRFRRFLASRLAPKIGHILPEIAGLDAIYRLGMGQVVDQVDIPGGNHYLARRFAFGIPGDGHYFRRIRLLHRNRLRADLPLEFLVQRLVKFVPDSDRQSQIAGVHMGRRVGRGQGRNKETKPSGCNCVSHQSCFVHLKRVARNSCATFSVAGTVPAPAGARVSLSGVGRRAGPAQSQSGRRAAPKRVPFQVSRHRIWALSPCRKRFFG